jgi:lipid A disaccharide synthetase
VVTIPGTNNLQLAAMGVPMLIVTPLNEAERIPVDGILGLLNYRVFPIGLIKRRLIQSKRGSVKYVSLPNIIAGREIVPEMLDILQPREVADKAVSLLADADRCAEMVRDLAEIARHGGAARKIAEFLLGEETPVTGGVGSP